MIQIMLGINVVEEFIKKKTINKILLYPPQRS